MTRLANLPVSQDKRHEIFLRAAYEWAYRLSTDPKTHVGAVITETRDEERIVSYGVNQLRRDIKGRSSTVTQQEMEMILHGNATKELLAKASLDSVWKYENTEHAEEVALSGLQKTANTHTMYLTWAPCMSCGNMIKERGLERLVMHKASVERTPQRWHESTHKALESLSENGMELILFDGELGLPHQFDNATYIA